MKNKILYITLLCLWVAAPNARAATVLDIRVVSETDDAEECVDDGAMYITSTDLELINDTEVACVRGDQEVGIRFQNVSIPKNAVIYTAHIEFVVDESANIDPMNLIIYGQKSPDTQPFNETPRDISGRKKTKSFVYWNDIPQWKRVGLKKQTPDISTIIKEIVDQPDWQKNNSMVIIITGSGKRTVQSFDGNPPASPLLHIEFGMEEADKNTAGYFCTNDTSIYNKFAPSIDKRQKTSEQCETIIASDLENRRALARVPFIMGAGFIAFIFLCFRYYQKKARVRFLEKSFIALKESFDELDEQAKLIIKTDLELNKTQEELDKRLDSLDALQKTSRLISTTLDESEIFERLSQTLMNEIGYEKNLILNYNEHAQLQCRVNHGFTDPDVEFITANLEKNEKLLSTLKEQNTISSSETGAVFKDEISRLFGLENFIIAPIITQNGFIGILIAGNISNTAPVTEGDEELVSILANQIGQSLENARLFEEVYRSRQALETKVQERTKELASALQKVQNISKTKSEFISAVSHELRTPLTSIKGYASILIAGKLGEVPPAVKERLEKINQHSDNLVKLINDLLDIARIESGHMSMNVKKSDLRSLIENVKDILGPQLKSKNLELKITFGPQIPSFNMDPTQVERIFINLISNAVKFTPENGLIEIKTHLDNDHVKIDVSDTGIGISDNDIEKLFDEFYRVENEINQNVKGTGLGLSLVKKIIEAHGGNILVTSRVNHGTTFHITLPINKLEETEGNEKS